MITPDEIKQKALNKYNEYLEIVAEKILLGTNCRAVNFFPLSIKSDKGNVTDEFSKRQKEYSELYAKSKNKMGTGYTIKEENIVTRKYGEQTKIKEIFFEGEDDYLSFIGKNKEVKVFSNNLFFVNEQYFSVYEFTNEYKIQWQKNFRSILISSDSSEKFWNDIFLCANWFKENENSNLYIREIPLSVHTKFIEENKLLIHSLVSENKMIDFEKEFGLKSEEKFIRFRSLDEEIKFEFNEMKTRDIQLTESEFENLSESDFVKSINTIFIVENKMIYLTFPNVPDAICIWGQGFGNTRISKSNWFKEKEIYYFGDIDEHGFEILSGFRKYNEKIKSFCMDKEALTAFGEFRVRGKTIKIPIENLNLTIEEKIVLKELQSDRMKNRLEQERISQDYILKMIKYLSDPVKFSV